MTITRVDALSPSLRAAVRSLAAAVEEEVGAPPLSDHTLLALGSSEVAHFVGTEAGALVGYAQRDGDVAEIAARTPAVGALASFVDAPLLWAHGKHSTVLPVAETLGYRRVRELWQLRRTFAPLPPLDLPPDVEIRPFRVGTDEDAWLAVNAAAFASHPEQGRWTSADLAAREGEPWFDPDGFLLAWRGSELLGFHWTKVHSDGMGEVYVLGVSPAAQGMRLGATLLVAGLAHLGERDVLLYVDGDNTAAIRLYEKYGFARHDLDVQLRRS